ncbi:MAG TPA: ribonuclease HII [Candidatus Kapabacteria bacterium]|nr:ribonuclease HII [Candidatus Kapabacteria bacterium]
MNRRRISWKYERQFLAEGCRLVAGIDEAGRGPLAGPVVAAAVLLPIESGLPRDCYGLNDSKQLSEGERERLFEIIHENALGIGIGIRSPQEIDKINILTATMLAMTDAVAQLEGTLTPQMLLVDGNYFRTTLRYAFMTIVDGDALSPSIAAASIIAKVTRDRIMRELHAEYPQYNFFRNKGYGTKEHRDAIAKFGFCDVHRRSFKLKSLQEQLFA